MNVPHEFAIELVKTSKVCEEMLMELQIPKDKWFDIDYIIEKLHTLRTVYFLHEENYQKKVSTVHEGNDTELISSTPLQ